MIERIDTFIFWQKWLFYTSLMCALFGILLAIYPDNPMFSPYFHAIATVFWPSSDIPLEVQCFKAFICGPLGGTIACCYLLMACIAWYPFKKKEVWARNAIMLSFGTWIILDSAVCLYYGVYFQVYMINAVSFLQKALPIIFTWNDFKKKISVEHY